MKRQSMLGGKVQLFKRDKSPFWQCTTFLEGKEWRKSSRQESLKLAKEFAEDWYLTLRNKKAEGVLGTALTFKKAAKKFEAEYEIITAGSRSPKWVEGHKARLRLHILPFLGDKPLTDINSGVAQDYRMYRMTEPKDWYSKQVEEKADTSSKQNVSLRPWRGPARNTLHNEVVTISMVLKTAQRHGWIEHVPDLSDPYRKQSKVEHRPWFTPKEYKRFYEATRANAKNPPYPRFRWYAEQLHDFVLFMANTGLRPDEAKRLEFRDVEIVEDVSTGQTILEIEVRGKRGVGYCKSMPGAVRPFERLRERIRPLSGKEPAATELLFPNAFKKMMNGILRDLDLKFDRDGKARTAYSLRHSYICFRLLEGADIYQVAKNCRTSVEMIEKHYAAHLKDMIDTTLVNVKRNGVRKET